MKIYKLTAISAAVAAVCGIAALIMNPVSLRREKAIYFSPAGDIALIIAMIAIIVFIITLIIALIYHKVESAKHGKLHEDNNHVSNAVLMRSGRYDEKYDRAVMRHKKEKEKHKFD